MDVYYSTCCINCSLDVARSIAGIYHAIYNSVLFTSLNHYYSIGNTSHYPLGIFLCPHIPYFFVTFDR